jgi:hypothetical protein
MRPRGGCGPGEHVCGTHYDGTPICCANLPYEPAGDVELAEVLGHGGRPGRRGRRGMGARAADPAIRSTRLPGCYEKWNRLMKMWVPFCPGLGGEPECPTREDYLPYCDPCSEPLCGDAIREGCPFPCPPYTRAGPPFVRPGIGQLTRRGAPQRALRPKRTRCGALTSTCPKGYDKYVDQSDLSYAGYCWNDEIKQGFEAHCPED